MHFVFDVRSEKLRWRAFMATTLELDEELDDEDVLELEFDESEVGAFEAAGPLSSSLHQNLRVLIPQIFLPPPPPPPPCHQPQTPLEHPRAPGHLRHSEG